MRKVEDHYRQWIKETVPSHLKKELLAIVNDATQIEDRFYQYLQFGTAGMRGVLGAGTNRMNIYTIRRAAYGLAQYITENGEVAKRRGVVIAYDTRHFSKDFAIETAQVLGALGVKVFVFRDARPTPELSFAVRYLNAFAGVVITASHNPKQYNGFKVYGEDGAQLTPSAIQTIVEKFDDIQNIFDIPTTPWHILEQHRTVEWVLLNIDQAYQEKLLALKQRTNIDFSIPIVYSPLHGAGLIPVQQGLQAFGFTNVHIVEQQAVQDGDFPTVSYPNPEEAAAFMYAIQKGNETDAQILLATDPDADRLGVAVITKQGYQLLTGNQLGALILQYLLEAKKEKNALPENGVLLKTIVTSELGAVIAQQYGVETVNTLTGFKYIAEKIAEYDKSEEKIFLFGYEESYGYLVQSFVRDKDAVQVALVVAEMAAYYATKQQTLLNVLDSLFNKYGYYQEALQSQIFEGISGQKEMQALLQNFRENRIFDIAGQKVMVIEDYLTQQAIHQGGLISSIRLPKENVLKFILEDQSWIAIRPSGTEPKCKFYFGTVARTKEQAQQKLKQLQISFITNK
ncbi:MULTISPECIES: phospho-sugar mutase [unclassified Lysinibacillus]|uniref:phospho-sugar mutase n=1 Tax=unclassified Lysinibacillus TaxID=2636778 RepID=UPI002011D3A3|nr:MULTISPECIES: phospho-sugar mutase [unclassified Lysinibacillus]MCL1695383.1 phospho-sugar mutase [Lysinibacillus sp. BPa_S21]MCL1703221.1 phospho-sugar mutase [Lysinibacillus sp. Bpr_S20]